MVGANYGQYGMIVSWGRGGIRRTRRNLPFITDGAAIHATQCLKGGLVDEFGIGAGETRNAAGAGIQRIGGFFAQNSGNDLVPRRHINVTLSAVMRTLLPLFFASVDARRHTMDICNGEE